MQLKRLWDTTTKQMVFAKWPTWHECQVWTDEEGSKLYIYDMAQWLEYTPWVSNEGKTYWPQWKAIDGDDEVGFYDTNEPTELYTWESGDEATYTFKDWDGTVLKTWKIDEGTAPTPPADPTRAATAQYTYTFAGWNPTVWPITKKTTYTATYTATVNKYTITATSSDADLWTVSPASVANVEYGTALTVADNVITVGTWESAPTITATAGEWNTFTGWLDWTTGLPDIPSTVTGNITVEAEFTAPALSLMNSTYWIEDSWVSSLVLFYDGGNDWDYSELPVTIVNRIEDDVSWDVLYDFQDNAPEGTSLGLSNVSYILSTLSSADLDLLLQWTNSTVDGTVCTFTSDAMTYINAVYDNTDGDTDPETDTTCQALLTYLTWVAWQSQSILVLPNA